MSAKRGRPLSGESDSVTVRERMRRPRQRQRATDNYTTTTTIAQSQQCENIISLGLGVYLAHYLRLRLDYT